MPLRVGITTGTSPEWSEELPTYCHYRDAVADAGLSPVRLESAEWAGATPQQVQELVRSLDGLLVSGGRDIDPAEFGVTLADGSNSGEERRSAAQRATEALHLELEPDRDAYELPIARAALASRLPVMGICRGFQLLNVVLGGRLILDLQGGLRHRAYPATRDSAYHQVEFLPGTLFESLGYPRVSETNSRHHQGVRLAELSPRLRPLALAPDDVIEAVEQAGSGWALAVQWHPERQQDGYVRDRDRALFRCFREACRDARRKG